ncbi:GNAT family N-acetyltransferase [Amycolatopsis sp. NBC_01488]|uniref:GNAT family N-acetyltransferase n=1 Tax=Amycolatopsis sp. NBC_01488 TaxID=2903563 RepID=UPI002E2D8DD1|nr:GNAT family N-acetyltransferase [Amycolatopsis sp. NBC_01488]
MNPTTEPVRYNHLGPEEAADAAKALTALYREVYAEPPYNWDDEHAELFAKRFEQQRQAPGFDLVVAHATSGLVGFTFGVTLLPDTPWWQNLIAEVDSSLTEEYPDRTFALVELIVAQPWRQRGIGKQLYDRLLAGRREERATLTVLPAAEPAQRAYAAWGWRRVAQKRNPLPGSPVFDVMVKDFT